MARYTLIKFNFLCSFLTILVICYVNGQQLDVNALTNGLSVEEKRQMLSSLRETLGRIRAARNKLNAPQTSQPFSNSNGRTPTTRKLTKVGRTRHFSNVAGRSIPGAPSHNLETSPGFSAQQSPSRTLPNAQIPRHTSSSSHQRPAVVQSGIQAPPRRQMISGAAPGNTPMTGRGWNDHGNPNIGPTDTRPELKMGNRNMIPPRDRHLPSLPQNNHGFSSASSQRRPPHSPNRQPQHNRPPPTNTIRQQHVPPQSQPPPNTRLKQHIPPQSRPPPNTNTVQPQSPEPPSIHRQPHVAPPYRPPPNSHQVSFTPPTLSQSRPGPNVRRQEQARNGPRGHQPGQNTAPKSQTLNSGHNPNGQSFKPLGRPDNKNGKKVGISVEVKRKTEVKNIPAPTPPGQFSRSTVSDAGMIPPQPRGHPPRGSSSLQPTSHFTSPQPNSHPPTMGNPPPNGHGPPAAHTTSRRRPLPTSPSLARKLAGPKRKKTKQKPLPKVVTLPRFIRWETLYPNGQSGLETAEALPAQRLVLVVSEQVPMYDEYSPSSTLMDFNTNMAAIRMDMHDTFRGPVKVCFTMKNPANLNDTKKELLLRSKTKVPIELGEMIHLMAAADNVQDAMTLQRDAGPFISKFCEEALYYNNVYKIVPEAPMEPKPEAINISGLVTPLDRGRSLAVNIVMDSVINFFGPNQRPTVPP